MTTYSVFAEWNGAAKILGQNMSASNAARLMATARMSDANSDIYATDDSTGNTDSLIPSRGTDGDWKLVANSDFSRKDAEYMLARD